MPIQFDKEIYLRLLYVVIITFVLCDYLLCQLYREQIIQDYPFSDTKNHNQSPRSVIIHVQHLLTIK